MERNGFSDPDGLELGQQRVEIKSRSWVVSLSAAMMKRRREVARNIGNWRSLLYFPSVVLEVGNSYVINDGCSQKQVSPTRMELEVLQVREIIHATQQTIRSGMSSPGVPLAAR